MPLDLSRRELVGSSLALGALFLAGCKNNQVAHGDDLPAPVRPGGSPAPPPPLAQTTRAPVQAPGAVGPAPGVIQRASWTSRGPARPGEINPMNGVNRITVHHDGMDPFSSTSQADAARRLEMIRASHINRRPQPFADIGYHFIIDPAGRVWEGRSVRYQGAHVQDHNEHNLGIMVMGNFDRQRPTPAATNALDRFVAAQMRAYRVPIGRVYTHQELNPTACPGRNLQGYMVASRRGGNLRMAAGLMQLDVA
ncbi:MAG: peptidoglycan recognition family protein [Phycisphaerales bacterium]